MAFSLIGVLGIVLLIGGIAIIWRSHWSGKIDVADIIIDSGTGKTSIRKVGELVALLVTTFLLVLLATGDNMTEGYYGLYLGAWVARTLLGQITQAKAVQMEK